MVEDLARSVNVSLWDVSCRPCIPEALWRSVGEPSPLISLETGEFEGVLGNWPGEETIGRSHRALIDCGRV